MSAAAVRARPAPNLTQVQEALRQSEELHRIILTNISDSVFLTDDAGRFTFICPNVDNIFGYSFDEIYSMKNISVLLGKDLYHRGRLDEVPEIRNIERVVRDKGGAPHTVLVNVKKVDIKHGTRLFTCRDITEYKRVKEELTRNILHRKKVERDLALFFNLSADMFAIIDAHRLRKINPAWSATLGIPPSRLAGRRLDALVHPDDLKNEMALERRLRAGDVVRHESRYRHRDGSYRWISWISTMSDEGRIHAVGRDVTAKRKEEDEIKRRLLRFKLQAGRAYLINERSPVRLSEAFQEMLGLSGPALVISRREREVFSAGAGRDFGYLWLADADGKGTVGPSGPGIEAVVDGLPAEHVIVLDSLEYLVRKMGFPAVLGLVEHLREKAFFKNHIVMIGVDGSGLGRREMGLLEKEAPALECYPGLDMPDDAVPVLRRIYDDNARGARPTRTGLCRALGLSHPTVRKRLAELRAMELVWEFRAGRSSVVEITEKGRLALLHGNRPAPRFSR
jgi:PAS domain S-box-containing protein